MKESTKRLSKDQKKRIVDLYKSKYNESEILNIVGCSKGQYRQVVYIENDLKKESKKILSRSEIQVVITFHKLNMTFKEIAEYFEISMYSLRKQIRDNRIKLPYRKNAKQISEN